MRGVSIDVHVVVILTALGLQQPLGCGQHRTLIVAVTVVVAVAVVVVAVVVVAVVVAVIVIVGVLSIGCDDGTHSCLNGGHGVS